jgi:glycosyltransferase 2 family protein
MSRTLWVWARLLGGAAIVTVPVWQLRTGPFILGIRSISGWSLAAAAGIGVVTTVCCAWRWSAVVEGLGVGVPLSTAGRVGAARG